METAITITKKKKNHIKYFLDGPEIKTLQQAASVIKYERITIGPIEVVQVNYNFNTNVFSMGC